MKTFKKVLYFKEYEAPIKYGYEKEHKVKTYIEIILWFNLKEGLRFSVGVANTSFCSRNIFEAFIWVLQHESIGMQKYQQMKSDARDCGVFNKLDVKFLKPTNYKY